MVPRRRAVRRAYFGTTGTRTWREFERSGVLTPQRMLDTGWEGLVRILDRGGYTRYDYKTTTKLLEINRTLLADYGGNLNVLHAAATDSVDLERRVMALGKGIGPITAGIFLRELRGRWTKAAPPLLPLSAMAAHELGLQAEGDAPRRGAGLAAAAMAAGRHGRKQLRRFRSGAGACGVVAAGPRQMPPVTGIILS